MPDAATASWAQQFTPFGVYHALCAAVCLGVMIGLCLLGRRWRNTAKEQMLRRVWAWSIVAWQSYALVWWLVPSHFNLNESLPLYVCDLAVWLAPVALLTNNRLARTILYFWGIALCTQGFITPVERVGFAHMRFWLFWIGHTQIVGSAVYVVVAMGYRPRWRDYRQVAVVGLAYTAFVFLLNIALHTNYGYVGNRTPDTPTLVDRLGPWPMRVVWLVMIGLAAQAAVLLPWVGQKKGDDPALSYSPDCQRWGS